VKTGAVTTTEDAAGLTDLQSLERTPMDDVMQAPLLHGTLEVWLYEAKNMPNMDLFSERCRRCFSCLSVCKPPFVKAKAKVKKHSHGHRSKGITSDPYAYVVLAGAKVASTHVIINNANPRWNEHFQIPVAHFTNEILIVIKDEDMVGAQHIGEVRIPAEEVLKKQVVSYTLRSYCIQLTEIHSSRMELLQRGSMFMGYLTHIFPAARAVGSHYIKMLMFLMVSSRM
jgi:hypothetical protein